MGNSQEAGSHAGISVSHFLGTGTKKDGLVMLSETSLDGSADTPHARRVHKGLVPLDHLPLGVGCTHVAFVDSVICWTNPSSEATGCPLAAYNMTIM